MAMVSSREKVLESIPVDPALLESANKWFDISWYGLLLAGASTALSAFATVAFLFVQFWSSGVRERHSEWRTSVLELQTAEAKKDTAEAQERIAELNNETARLNVKGALVADAVSATAQATKANALAAQFLLALSQQLAKLMMPGMQMPGFLSVEQHYQIVSKVKPFAGKQFDVDIDITSSGVERAGLLGSLIAALIEAGWIQVDRREPPSTNLASVRGIAVNVDASNNSELLVAAATLASALNAEGIAATTNLRAENGTASANVIHILAGHSP
jgi:hypothetical protein